MNTIIIVIVEDGPGGFDFRTTVLNSRSIHAFSNYTPFKIVFILIYVIPPLSSCVLVLYNNNNNNSINNIYIPFQWFCVCLSMTNLKHLENLNKIPTLVKCNLVCVNEYNYNVPFHIIVLFIIIYNLYTLYFYRWHILSRLFTDRTHNNNIRLLFRLVLKVLNNCGLLVIIKNNILIWTNVSRNSNA